MNRAQAQVSKAEAAATHVIDEKTAERVHF